MDHGVKQAVVVGAGFIGLELVENFVRRGIAATVVELQDQVLPPFDKEMTTPLAEHLAAKGVTLLLGQSAEAFEQGPDGLTVVLKSGMRLPAQLVILGVGVRPENKLAVDAGLRGRSSWRHPGQRASANQRSGHLCGGRRHRGQGLRDRRADAGAAGRTGEPPGPDRRRPCFRARCPLPGNPGNGHRSRVRPDGGDDRGFRKSAAPSQPAVSQGLRSSGESCRLLSRCRGDDASSCSSIRRRAGCWVRRPWAAPESTSESTCWPWRSRRA